MGKCFLVWETFNESFQLFRIMEKITVDVSSACQYDLSRII